MAYYSPLRYPGGKQKLFKSTKELILKNTLPLCTYIEPFAGGCGLALALLIKGVVNNIVLNDIDPSIYSFWHAILYNTDEFCRMIESTPVNIDEWYKQKDIQLDKSSSSLLDLGFSTFFLNRTNRSGIITGGVMGGKDQQGKYKIDCRFNKDNLIKRIRKISSYKDSIEFYNMDAVDFINEIIPDKPDNSFIFLDPPYYKKGPGLYENHYQHQDHLNLSTEITSKIRQPWIVTYDNVEPIRSFYSGYIQQGYDLNYSAQKKYVGKEIMIFSHNLTPLQVA